MVEFVLPGLNNFLNLPTMEKFVNYYRFEFSGDKKKEMICDRFSLLLQMGTSYFSNYFQTMVLQYQADLTGGKWVLLCKELHSINNAKAILNGTQAASTK